MTTPTAGGMTRARLLRRPSGPVSGTGTYNTQCTASGGQPMSVAFTWQEIADETDGIELTNPASGSLAPFESITSIAPNDNDTAFSYHGGDCTLMSGAIPPGH
jgi:hypothetical protein